MEALTVKNTKLAGFIKSTKRISDSSSWFTPKAPETDDFKRVSSKLDVDFFVRPTHNFFLFNGQSLTLPNSLSHLEGVIMDSGFIFDLEENWDDEGALKISNKSIWNAIHFLINYSTFVLKEYNIILKEPTLLPCSDGSVDLTWNNDTARMLINFRNSDDNEAHYYGDLYSDITQFKGSFTTGNFQEHIAMWLKLFKK